jgi:hypothetical protein
MEVSSAIMASACVDVEPIAICCMPNGGNIIGCADMLAPAAAAAGAAPAAAVRLCATASGASCSKQ